MNNNFKNLTDNIGLDLNETQLSQFERLFERLVTENEKYNLTAIVERDSVYSLHFFDSLLAHSYIDKNANLCDVGSGGGFPALPLKIARPDIKLTMIDSVNKKVKYLNETATILGLKNAEAFHTRVEDIAKSPKRESFDCVTSRAVAKLPTLLEYCLPLVKVGGLFIAYKTDVEEEVLDSQNALYLLGGKVEKIVDLSSEDGVRTLVLVRKVKPTPKQFPRGKNKERTEPL